MEITVNLAKRPFLDLRPIIKALSAGIKVLSVFVLLLGVTAYIVHRKASSARSRIHAIEEQISRIHSERRAYQELLRHAENLRIQREAEGLNQILDAKVFSWTLVMKDLEIELPDKVQVASIEPERAKDGNTTLHVRVLGPRDKDIEFLNNLEMSDHFLFPRMVGESPNDNNEGPNQKQIPVDLSTPTEVDLLTEYSADDPDQTQTVPTRGNSEQKAANGVTQTATNQPTRTPPSIAGSNRGGTK